MVFAVAPSTLHDFAFSSFWICLLVEGQSAVSLSRRSMPLAFALAFEVGKDIVLCPKESSAFSTTSLAILVPSKPFKVSPESSHRFAGESSPISLGSSVGKVDGLAGFGLCHV